MRKQFVRYGGPGNIAERQKKAIKECLLKNRYSCKVLILYEYRFFDIFSTSRGGLEFAFEKYDKPTEVACFAQDSMPSSVMALARDGENFYDGWMKNKKSAMISCNDGFRLAGFLLETMDKNTD